MLLPLGNPTVEANPVFAVTSDVTAKTGTYWSQKRDLTGEHWQIAKREGVYRVCTA